MEFIELSKEIFNFKWENSSALKAFSYLLQPVIWTRCYAWGVKEKNLRILNCRRSPDPLRLVLKKKKKIISTSVSISHSNCKKEISLQWIFPSCPKHLGQFILYVLQESSYEKKGEKILLYIFFSNCYTSIEFSEFNLNKYQFSLLIICEDRMQPTI